MGKSYINDIWSSNDGINWSMLSGFDNNQYLKGSWKHSCIVQNDTLIIIGGVSVPLNDIM